MKIFFGLNFSFSRGVAIYSGIISNPVSDVIYFFLKGKYIKFVVGSGQFMKVIGYWKLYDHTSIFLLNSSLDSEIEQTEQIQTSLKIFNYGYILRIESINRLFVNYRGILER